MEDWYSERTELQTRYSCYGKHKFCERQQYLDHKTLPNWAMEVVKMVSTFTNSMGLQNTKAITNADFADCKNNLKDNKKTLMVAQRRYLFKIANLISGIYCRLQNYSTAFNSGEIHKI